MSAASLFFQRSLRCQRCSVGPKPFSMSLGHLPQGHRVTALSSKPPKQTPFILGLAGYGLEMALRTGDGRQHHGSLGLRPFHPCLGLSLGFVVPVSLCGSCPAPWEKGLSGLLGVSGPPQAGASSATTLTVRIMGSMSYM